MKEILNEILAAEKRAEKLLDEARAEALALKQSVEKEATEKIAAARQEAQLVVSRSAEEARREAQKARDEQIALAAQRDRDEAARAESRSGRIVHAIVDLVVRSDTGRDI
jgi:vacuolar-type H+-ATPase subunit H